MPKRFRFYAKGPSIKDVRSQGGGGCPVRTFCGQGGGVFFRCGRPHFLAQKHQIFRNLGCARTDKEGEVSQDKGRGQFCADVFYGRPLLLRLHWGCNSVATVGECQKNWLLLQNVSVLQRKRNEVGDKCDKYWIRISQHFLLRLLTIPNLVTFIADLFPLQHRYILQSSLFTRGLLMQASYVGLWASAQSVHSLSPLTHCWLKVDRV